MTPGYTKLFSDIVTSSLWQEDHATRIVWVTMLALADRDGFVSATIPGLANLANVTVEECEMAIEKFLSPDKYSRTVTDEGRRVTSCDGGWTLINHGKYRSKMDAQEQREKARERKKRQREREKSADVTENVTECHAESRSVTQCHDNQKKKKKQKKKNKEGETPSYNLPPGDSCESQEGGESEEIPQDEPSQIRAAIPRGATAQGEAKQKRIKVRRNTETMERLGALFGRRASTLWSAYEARALLDMMPLDAEELDLIERHYGKPDASKYLRRDLGTLLNNWPGEVDKARNWQPEPIYGKKSMLHTGAGDEPAGRFRGI